MRSKSSMVASMVREIELRSHYLDNRRITTVYFGGGTPSLLNTPELNLLLDTIHKHFSVDPDAEITLEANPDDLYRDSVQRIVQAGINRLSIGIQSFHEPHLRFLNRAHNASQASDCVKIAQDTGIENMSVDLIYAIPHKDHSILQRDIEMVSRLDIPHLSAYCLTIEPQTAFGSWVKTKKMAPIDDEFAATQFEILTSSLARQEYEQYEISNFAREGRYSRHNTAYWQRRPYLGIGPSAHSYNGVSREYNVPNNATYVKALGENQVPSTLETLSYIDQTNEYLLTGLRTKWGVETEILHALSGGDFFIQHSADLEQLVAQNLLKIDRGVILLTDAGKLFADKITGDLFIE
jgi:oxygen-independent coproporphyrinogen III oxidase